MNRLVLNLRSLSTSPSSSVQSRSNLIFRSGHSFSPFSSFIRRFNLNERSILGNIGEPLDKSGDGDHGEAGFTNADGHGLGMVESGPSGDP